MSYMDKTALQGCGCDVRPYTIEWEVGAGRHAHQGDIKSCKAHLIQRRCAALIELERRYPALTPRLSVSGPPGG